MCVVLGLSVGLCPVAWDLVTPQMCSLKPRPQTSFKGVWERFKTGFPPGLEHPLKALLTRRDKPFAKQDCLREFHFPHLHGTSS